MTGPIHEYPVTIREHHLDTFGHVNNATYLELLEEARWEWITVGGYGLSTVVELRQGPTIVECTLEFSRELRNRTEVVIRSWAESYVGKIAIVRQDIVGMGDAVHCKARFKIGLFDTRERRLIDPTDAWLNCVGFSRDAWQPKG